MTNKQGKERKFRIKAVVVALLCGGALAVWSETANNLFVSVTGPGVKVVDGTTFSVTGDVSQIEVKAMPGWQLKTPDLQILKSNRSGRWRVTSLLGEDAEGGDVCHPSEDSVENHIREPQVAATIQSDRLSYVYAAPATGAVVTLSASSSLLRQGRHEIVTIRHSCPGTERDEVTESTAEVNKEPDTYRWNWSFGDWQGTASGASFTTSVTNVTKGGYTVGADLAASVSDCSECVCSANASTNLVVSELRVETGPWIGIDRTDAATPPWTNLVAAALDPSLPGVDGVKWDVSDRLRRFSVTNWTCSVGTGDKDAASPAHLADEVRATVAGMTAVTNLTVVNLNVAISGVSEEDEETIGAFVGYVPDADEDGTWTEEGTNKLVAVSITCEPSDLPTNEMVTVSAPAGFLYEKIGNDYVAATNVYKACEISGKQFYLHGHAPSTEARDKSITVTHPSSGAVDMAVFAVLGTIVTEVSFSGGNTTLVSDLCDMAFTAPHYLDANANGVLDSRQDHSYPVACVRNRKMVIAAEFSTAYGFSLLQVPLVRCRSEETVFNTRVSISNAVAYVVGNRISLPATLVDRELPDRIDVMDPLALNWEVSFDGGVFWECAGTSTNRLYVTWTDPQVSTNVETFFSVGCEAARGTMGVVGVNDNIVLDRIWQKFQTKNIRRASDNRVLTYYGFYDANENGVWDEGDFDCNSPKRLDVTRSEELVATCNGQCHSWAEFFIRILSAQGLPRINADNLLSIVRVDSKRDGSAFAIKNWRKNGSPPYLILSSYAGICGENIIETELDAGVSVVWDVAGIPGQGSSPNPPSNFSNHFIVRIGNYYYDPSYGTGPCASLIDYERQSFEGFFYENDIGDFIFEDLPMNDVLINNYSIW